MKVTGELKYVGDMKMPRMLTAKMLLSPYAHARIKSIDYEEAEKLPGVHAVVCYKNTPRYLYNSYLRIFEDDIPRTEQVFSDVMRFVGDRVAAVAAEDAKIAEAALKLIKVEYEELPAVFDPEKALEEGAPAIHEGGNKVGEEFTEAGNVDEAWDQCDRIFEDRYEMPPLHHMAMETHVAIADYNSRGKLTIWSPSQNTFNLRILLSRIFDLPMTRVRLIRPAIGGAFGSKIELNLEVVVAALAIKAKRPVKLLLNRKDNMVLSRTRHEAIIYIKTGVKNDGTVLAQDFKVITNTGAYASSAMDVVGAMAQKPFKVYKIPNMRFRGIPVYTNKPIACAMRGFGSPQIFNAQQVQFAKIARELGLDLVEFQLKNAVKPDGIDQRWKTPIGNPRVEDAIRRGAELFNWEERKKTKNSPLEAGWKRGIGMSVGSHGNSLYGAHRDIMAVSLKPNEDGTFVLYTGAHDMGNGSVTMQTQMVASILGIQPEDVETVEADTDLVPYNLADYASRGVFVEGTAAKKVAENMKGKLAEKASNFLDCMVGEVEFANGCVQVKGDSERKMTLGELITKTQMVDQEELMSFESYASSSNPTSYGVHFVELWVNEAAHKVKIIDYVAVHDIGTIINRMGIEGQLEGGIEMGIGYALYEGLYFDDKGKLINNTLKRYGRTHPCDMPQNLTIDFIEANEPAGPYGAKSIGECATVPVSSAVFSAVCDALGEDLHKFPARI
ncbi:MAG: molybdopterin-dependent oxidoreductase [Anaerolineae bacterium]|nr:molybdopterin-dependent oxidoreductase [Anaerolineae bacterium]